MTQLQSTSVATGGSGGGNTLSGNVSSPIAITNGARTYNGGANDWIVPAASGNHDGDETVYFPASSWNVSGSAGMSPAWNVSGDIVVDPSTGAVTGWDATVPHLWFITRVSGSMTSTMRALLAANATAPRVSSVSVSGTSLTVNWSDGTNPMPVWLVDTTGLSFDVHGGTAATVTAIASGNGSSSTVLTISRSFTGADTIDFLVASVNKVLSIAGSVLANSSTTSVPTSFLSLFGANARALWESDSGVTTGGGGTTLTGWLDQVAGLNLAPSATAPTWHATDTDCHNKPSVEFTGTQDLQSASTLNLSNSSKIYDAWAIKKTNTSGPQVYGGNGTTNAQDQQWFVAAYTGGASEIEAYTHSTAGGYPIASTATTEINAGSGFHFLEVIIDRTLGANAIKIYVDSVLVAQGPGSYTDSHVWGIFKIVFGMATFLPHMKVCARFIADIVPSAPQRAAVAAGWARFTP